MAGSVAYTGIVSSGKGVTTVTLANGQTQTFSGSRGYRNNNPGNLTSDSKSQRLLNKYAPYGAIGYDYGGNMVFNTMQGGFNAQKALVTGTYKNLTIGQMLNKYAPPGASNDPNDTNRTYPAAMEKAGWDLDTKISDLSPEQQNKLIADMIRKENTRSDAEKILEQVDPEYVGEASTPKEVDGDEGEDTVSEKSSEQSTSSRSNVSRNGNQSSGSSSQGRNETAAPSAGEYGFRDPDMVYPLPDYTSTPKTNKATVGEWEPTLKLPEGKRGKDLIPQEATPEYPNNKVTESPTGHRREVDDTPGSERLSETHVTGSGYEIREDGKVVQVSYGESVYLTGDNFTMIVNGDGDITYTGNLNLTVEGDMNLTVKGDMKTEVHGTSTEIYKKSHVIENQESLEETTTENKSVTVGGINTETSLQGKNTFVSGDQSNWIEGDAEYLSSGHTHISAEKRFSASAHEMNISGNTGSVVLDSGVIGGSGAFHTGYWSGDLLINGAAKATDDVVAFYADGGVLAAAEAEANVSKATQSGLEDTLTASDEAIMQVDVDPGDKIKESISPSTQESLGANINNDMGELSDNITMAEALSENDFSNDLSFDATQVGNTSTGEYTMTDPKFRATK